MPAISSSLPNHVEVNGLAVSFHAHWSSAQDANVTTLFAATPDALMALNAAELDATAKIHVTVERRLDHREAVERLHEIAQETSDSPTFLRIGGWPAVRRSHIGPREQPGRSKQLPLQTLLTITTAIAAGDELVRLEGRLPADAASATIEEIEAIEASVLAAPPGAHGTGASPAHEGFWARFVHRLKKALGLEDVSAGRPQAPAAPAPALGAAKPPSPAIQADVAEDEEDEEPPPVSEPGSGSAGAVSQVLLGGVASEPEVVVSSNGRNIVIGQQFVFTTSNDGGQTFPFFGNFPASTGGDTSLAFGQSGTFYEGTISNSSTAINVSTNNGQTFQFRANAFTCPTSGANQCPAGFPDQEHIGADRVNATVNGDQVYSAWRHLNGNYGIVCSSDGGNNWGTASFTAGDFPRIAVAQDGFVYVVYTAGGNIMLNKYAACSGNANMAAQAGFPVTIASGVSFVTCPMPGLDRCNNGNNLSSFTVAVDDTNAQHIYVSYAVNTSATNENIIVRDSTNGGSSWPAGRVVTVSSGATARRFMPWVCATQGTAFVSWYDRRAATAADNDLTDYFGASASLDGGGNLVAGTEFQISAAGTADAQCEAGKAVGAAGSWPGGTRATTDSESCSRQPQLAGRCQHSPPNATDSNQACDFTSTVCAAGETCQTLPTGGVPKYGDYNGNACAVGHFYSVWASATAPAGITARGIDLYFSVRDTVRPTASCQNTTVPTDPDVCFAANGSIDNGSTDPDGDTFTLSQSPPGPYAEGVTSVTLTITDQNSQTNSCSATVTVQDKQVPNISCPSPTVECTSPSGAVVTLNPTVSDNCPGVGTPACVPPSGSTFGLGTTPFTCSVADAAGNTNDCNSTVKVQDTTPPVIDSVSPSLSVLWPPNHKLTPVSIAVVAHDTCDPAPDCFVRSIASSEPPLGGGSGNTDPDFALTGPLSVALRAERDGTGNGRTYTITVECVDGSGNSATASTAVVVPHDRR